jgi:signal transduction histidine kinase
VQAGIGTGDALQKNKHVSLHSSSTRSSTHRLLRWPVASLRAYLALVIVMATVPLATFALFLLHEKLVEGRIERQQALYRTANSLALIVRRELDSSTDALVMLSHSDSLQGGDLQSFRRRLLSWPMPRPSWREVYLRAPDGRVVLTIARGATEAAPPVEQQAGARAADDGARRTVVEVPVSLRGGRYMLGAEIDDAHWERLLDQAGVPSDTFASLVDERTRVLAFEPDPRRFVGLQLPISRQAELVRAESDQRRWRVAPEQPLTVMQQVPGTQWMVAAGTIEGFGWRDVAALSSVLVAGLLSLGIGLVLAFRVARRVREPLRRLAAGDADGGTIVVREIAQLREALAQAGAERQQAMQALQAKADEFETVFRASPIGLAMTQDLAHPHALINPALATLLGCEPGSVDLSPLFPGTAEAGERNGARLCRGDQALDWLELPLWRAAAAGQVQPLTQLQLQRPDGHRAELLVHAVPLRGDAGRSRGAIAAFVDVTERTRLERERDALIEREQAARRAAEEANRGKDEFLAMLGHELRNPLSAITAAVEVINRLGPEEQAAQSARRIIGRQTQQLVGLMNDLSDIARIGAGKIALSRRTTDLARLVWRTHAALRVAGHFRRHTLTLALEPVLVDVDPMRIEQVVSNLLTNAAKYTPAGGHIRLHLALGEDGAADITVADDGVGMSPALLARVFELFVQGERSTQSQGGLGLGLALVRRLVELHGGSVTATSPGPGQGSMFRVRLPNAFAPGIHEPGPVLPPLLLVGASDAALQAIEGVVERGRCQVTLAPDPEAALRCLAEAQAERLCVLAPPELLAPEEIAAWRKLVPGLPIVALGGGEGEDRWIESGFDRLLSPPFPLQDLRSIAP